MDRDTIFLYVIAAIALCFGLINCIQIFFKRKQNGQKPYGTIISFKTINTRKLQNLRNSK